MAKKVEVHVVPKPIPHDMGGKFESGCRVAGISMSTAFQVWNDAFRFNSWDLNAFMATQRKGATIARTQEAIKYFLED